MLCYIILKGGFSLNNCFYTTEEVAKLLKVHVITVRRWLETGKMRGHKAGRQWRIQKQDIEDYLEYNK